MADVDADRPVMRSRTITDPTNQQWMVLEIQDDSSATAGWENRLEVYFTPDGGSPQLIAWFNEYGELRLMPAKDNTVALRIFGAVDATAFASRSTSVPLFEVVDERVNRNGLFQVFADAAIAIGGRRLTVGTTQPAGAATGAVHVLTNN